MSDMMLASLIIPTVAGMDLDIDMESVKTEEASWRRATLM
jgi:hypothetical protein